MFVANDSIKFSKKVLVISAIVLVLLILGSIYYFKILPAQKKQSEIKEYKKALYDSILCQYNCPMQNYTIQNQTQTIQNHECVVQCINGLKGKGYIKNQYSNNEINDDSLAEDIQAIVANCRQNSVDSKTNLPDSQLTTDCAISGLENLKEKYPYLK